MTRPPILPTLLVAAAVLTMITLGVWQIRRSGEKNALIAQHEAARGLPPVSMNDPRWTYAPGLSFRFGGARCDALNLLPPRAGHNSAGEPGYSYPAICVDGERRRIGHASEIAVVDLGWSRRPDLKLRPSLPARYSGMLVDLTPGFSPAVAPRYRLYAEQSAAPLLRSRPPGPENIPNNHLLYAAQWFFFALAATVIYGLALRRRQSKPASN